MQNITILNTEGQLIKSLSQNDSGRFHSIISKNSAPLTGEFFDEISLGLIGAKNPSPEILILGAGLGSCIISINSIFPESRFTLVDINEESLQTINIHYHSLVTEKRLETYLEDANQFVTSKNKKYDYIFIDLFNNKGYCDLVFKKDFIEKIKGKLNPNSNLAFNVYGIPYFLFNKEENPLQNHIDLLVGEGTLKIYPYRRNHLLVWKNLISVENNQIGFINDRKIESRSVDIIKIQNDYNYYLKLKSNNGLPIPETTSSNNLDFSYIRNIEKTNWLQFCKVHNIKPNEIMDLLKENNSDKLTEMYCNLSAQSLEISSSILIYLIFAYKAQKHFENCIEETFHKIQLQSKQLESAKSLHFFWTHYWGFKNSQRIEKE